jgi:tetratricopeptide (TPR) repeat protein
MEAEGWGRIAELYQGRGQHAKAKEVLTRLVKLHAMELESCRGRGGREGEAEGGMEGGEEGRGHPRQQEEAWRTAIGRQIQEEAGERLANVRVRLAASMRELGETTEALAQLNTAEQELRRAEAGEDLSMVHVLTGKAELYCEREEYVRALEIYEDALERRRKTVPREDPELASLLVGMAEVYAEKGDTDVALGMLVQAYRRIAESKEPAFGKSGAEGANAASAPGSLSSSSFTSSASVSTPPRSLHKTASTASHSPSSTASSSCSEDDSERCRRGRELMVMAGALERIAQIFTSKKQLDDALMCHKAAHERKSAALARAHPAIALSLARMAAIYETKKDLKAAAAMHARALEVRRAVLPPTCPEIASSLFGLANAHQRLCAFESALAAYEEAEMIRRINVPRGETAPGAMLGLGDVLVNMSRPLKSLGRDLEAMAKLRDARETYLAAGLPMTDTRLKTVAENLKVLGMHLHKNIETATEGSGWAGGSASLPRTRRGSVGREELLVRHAASSASGPDWLPSKSRSASAPPSMKASKGGSTGGHSVPRSESLDQKRQQCSIQ